MGQRLTSHFSPNATFMHSLERSQSGPGLMETPEPAHHGAAPASPGARPGRRWIWILLLIGAATGAGLWPRWRQREATQARTRELAVSTVTVTSPQAAKPSAPLPFPAELIPEFETFLRARANGFLRTLHVDIGSKVEAGQLLAEIDIPDLDAEERQSRAELAQAQAAQVLAEKTAYRWNELFKSNNVSAQENEEKQADLALKNATVDAAKARLQRLTELQGFSKVTAPFAGTIVSRTTSPGNLVSPDSTLPLFRLADTRKLRVWVRIPQSMTALAVVGAIADLQLPEKPGKRFAATVTRTAGAIAADSKTLLVELSVDNSSGELLAGSYGQVLFKETVSSGRLSLPANALLFRPDGPQVGLVKADGVVELRPVTLGRDFGREVEIISGVEPSDRVILNPRDSLASGMRVQVASPNGAKP